MITWIPYLSVLGIGVSCYALHVEHKAATLPHYKAACDISDRASCSKVLTSKYSHLLSYWGIVPKGHALDLPNAGLGLIFYGLMLFAPFLPFLVIRAGATASLAISLYLARILYVMKDVCLVCFAAYAVNGMIFLAAFAYTENDYSMWKEIGPSWLI